MNCVQHGALLKARGLTFSYHNSDQPILRDLDITLQPEQMTAIVGTNGAGKSTLLKLLAGVMEPSSGKILVGEESLRSMPARQRAQQLAFVAQEEQPPFEMEVTDFVSLGRLPYSSRFGVMRASDHEVVQAAIQLMRIENLAGRNSGELSGGQRRRVVIARGIAQRSPFLLLDEPTNHLDVCHQHQVLNMVRESHSTVVAAIHDLDLVLTYFDRVIVLHEASVFADGPPVDVLTQDVVQQVFGVRSHIEHVEALRHPHLLTEKFED